MLFANPFRPGQVGDGAGHAQDAVVGAGRPLEVFHAAFELGPARLVGLAQAVDFAGGEVLVALALARQLDLGRTLHAGGNRGGRFAVGVGGQGVGFHGGDFDLHVDAVEQGAGNTALVMPIVRVKLTTDP